MIILLSLFVRFCAMCANTVFLAISLTLFAFAIMVPSFEFLNSINVWPDTWLSDSHTPMTAMEQLAYSLKLTMFGIAFHTVGAQIETWSKKLPSLEDTALKAQIENA